jgi:hypothetical protein
MTNPDIEECIKTVEFLKSQRDQLLTKVESLNNTINFLNMELLKLYANE